MDDGVEAELREQVRVMTRQYHEMTRQRDSFRRKYERLKRNYDLLYQREQRRSGAAASSTMPTSAIYTPASPTNRADPSSINSPRGPRPVDSLRTTRTRINLRRPRVSTAQASSIRRRRTSSANEEDIIDLTSPTNDDVGSTNTDSLTTTGSSTRETSGVISRASRGSSYADMRARSERRTAAWQAEQEEKAEEPWHALADQEQRLDDRIQRVQESFRSNTSTSSSPRSAYPHLPMRSRDRSGTRFSYYTSDRTHDRPTSSFSEVWARNSFSHDRVPTTTSSFSEVWARNSFSHDRIPTTASSDRPTQDDTVESISRVRTPSGDDESASISLAIRLQQEEFEESWQHAHSLGSDPSSSLTDYLRSLTRRTPTSYLEEHSHQSSAWTPSRFSQPNRPSGLSSRLRSVLGMGDMDYDEMMQLEEEMGDVSAERWRQQAPDIISELPTRKYGSSGESDTFCVVCQENYKKDETVLTLPCAHLFHEGCVRLWVLNHNSCPICKRKVSETSPAA